MNKSTFIVAKMDCPSEEQMIRMKLDGVDGIRRLAFDIPNRQLAVFHTSKINEFENRIYDLKLDAVLKNSVPTQEPIGIESDQVQRRVLWQVLIINLTFFVLEIIYGWISSSMGLVADSLDMLADSIVYGMSLLAVGALVAKKKKIAKISGYFQIGLAMIGLIEVIRRFIGVDEIPVFQTMIIISFLALMANTICLYLIQKAKSNEAHMQASAIFTSNDIIINAGVIAAGILVYLFESKYPDLIVGSVIFLIVVKGAIRILNLAR